MKIKPGLPCVVHEVVYFEIAHFAPTAVCIHIEGLYASLALSLPRSEGVGWLEKVDRARARLQVSGSLVLQRILQKDPKHFKQLQGLILL